jgi:hypothetical protein
VWRDQPLRRCSFVDVPGERLSARARFGARRAAVAVILLVAVFIGYLAITRHQPVQRQTACFAGASESQAGQMQVSQAAIAATIAGVADRRSMPDRALAIAYATALQESDLANLPYGDLDSVGVFQQRPSQGWGTAKQIENPVYASNRFFAALAAVPGYQHMPIYQAAQAVQHSADGQAYAQWATAGSQLAAEFSGSVPHGVWCSYASVGHKVRLLAASRALAGTFGPLTQRTAVSGRDPVRTVAVRDQRQGWAVAAWLVTNARSYGIKDVRYRGFEWLAYTAAGRWVRQRGTAAGAAVVFG